MQSVIAYLDPGSGSIVLQAILGGIGGIALLWARMRHRIRAKLGRGAAADHEPTGEEEPTAEHELAEESTAGQ